MPWFCLGYFAGSLDYNAFNDYSLLVRLISMNIYDKRNNLKIYIIVEIWHSK